jgi:hypothetical protein
MSSIASTLAPTQALYVLDALIRQKRISRSEVDQIIREMADEIDRLEKRLEELRGAHQRRRASGRSSPRDAQTAASRKLQGYYMSLIRQVPAQQRGRFKTIAATKGREAAVEALRKVVNPGR